MTIEIHWESSRLLCLKYSGTIQGDEVLAAQRSLTNDERFYNIREYLIDGSALTKSFVSDTDIEKISAITIAQSKTNPDVKNALVLSQNLDEDDHTLGAYYQFLADATGWEIELFKTVSEARNWLGCER
ncbi:hypothetical protein [Oceanicoccus sp. KOV_DT_Chl]|uniref:hypothetical protein n=1 Tax=Oceanicoccus sp. KOV_DT_Chl TaxID=1904639 RepID=UPI000C7C1C14|nr:hypothetical protein [Oceanicoccus sp. KOV_DT_Chl]